MRLFGVPPLRRFHLSCSADILVCGFAGHSCPVFHPYESGDWKVARTRRLESLRYIITVYALMRIFRRVQKLRCTARQASVSQKSRGENL